MPLVTSIGPAKRRSGWFEIQLDGASCILLPDDQLTRLGISEGLRLDDAEVERLRARAESAEARRVALRYLSVRPRSRHEVELRLRRERTSARAIADTIERFAELGYLDDRRFAAAFVRDRIRLKPCGLRRLRADLWKRGVDREDAEAGISEAFAEEETSEAELLERAASSRARRLDRLDPRVARRRLFGFLVRRGFDARAGRAWVEARWPD